MKKLNLFYVGSADISAAFVNGENHEYTQPNLDTAIARAKQRLTDDPALDGLVIVRIVKVVRRKTPPIVVEDVR